MLLARNESPDVAAQLVGASHALRDRAGIVPWPGLRPVMAAIFDGVRAVAGEEVFERNRQIGRHLDLDAVEALTRSLVPATSSA